VSNVDLNLRADLSSLRSELAKIPGVTEAEAKKMVKALAANFKAAERATAGAAKKMDSEFKGALGDIQQGAQVAFGGVVGDIVDMGKAFGGVATAIGPVGVGIAGAGVAAVGAVAGLAMLQRAALGSVDALHGLGIPVDPAMEASIEQANAAMDALGAGFNQAIVVIGAKFAPVVQQGAELILHFGYQAADAIAAFGDGQVTLEAFAKFLTGAFVDALTSPIRTLALFGMGVAELGEALGMNVEHLRRGSEMVMGFADQAKAAAVETIDLDGVLSNLDPRVRKLTEATLKSVRARNDDAKATKKQTDSNRELEAALGRWGSLTEQVSAIAAEAAEDQMTDVDRVKAKWEGVLGELERARVAYQNLGEQGVFVSAELAKVNEAEAAVKERLVRDVEALGRVTEDLTTGYTANAEAAGASSSALQQWAQENQELVATVGQLSTAVTDIVTSVTDQVIDAAEQQAAAAERVRDRQAAAYEAARSDFEANSASMSETDRAAHQARLDNLRAQAEASEASYDRTRRAARKAAIAAYETQKTAALVNAAIQSGVVFMAMLASPGIAALGPWAPAAAGGIALAALATSVGMIMAAPRPKFHVGGIVGDGAGPAMGSPDEVNTTLTTGEGVLTRRGVSAAGGPDAVAAMNRGERNVARGGGDATNLWMNGRLQAQLWSDGRVRVQGTSPVIGSRYGMVY
jgi:hypothetical protein